MSDVLARIEGKAGHITLNRPAALNALTLDMVRAIDQALAAWETDDAVALILMDGAGERGFCAGGDIRALYDAAKAQRLELPEMFFREEYHLNRRIARYAKPIVALMDGVVMGGGIGLGGHSSHRVVTERSVLAMPETRIGFIPDVGGTYLLGTAPGELGTHAALSGGRMDGADAIAVGLADVFVPSAKLDELRRVLIEEGSASALMRFSEPPPDSKLGAAQSWIDRCYAHDDAEAIVAALDAASEPEAHKAAAEIRGASPSSVKITLQALRRARAYDALEPCLAQEFTLALSILRDPDFVEGVRAAIVDKDRNPAWSPARLEDVTSDQVERHFQEKNPLWQD
jgi:enoyl-CoA hydratase